MEFLSAVMDKKWQKNCQKLQLFRVSLQCCLELVVYRSFFHVIIQPPKFVMLKKLLHLKTKSIKYNSS